MNYVKIAFLVAIIVAVASFAPSFVSALEIQDNGTTAGEANTPPVQDNGTTAGEANTPPIQDNGTTAGSGDSNLPPVQDNGTTAGTDTSSGSPGGGSGRRTVASSGVIKISDIKITLPGSSTPVTSLSRGLRYVISWSASRQNTNTAINFVNTSTGASTPIGVSSNGSAVNTFTWVVPSTLALGNYVLQFTDSGNRTTISTETYTVTKALTSIPVDASGRGAGTGAQGQAGATVGSAGDGEISGFPLVIGEEVGNGDSNSQLAAVGEANGFFSKYFLWFLIVLLVIAGVILAREHRNKIDPKI